MGSLQQVFATAIAETKAGLIERNDETDIIFTSLVVGENCLFVGPPGVAKSMFTNTVVKFLSGRLFNYLLSKFTDPSELFGMYDMKRIAEKGEYVRNTAGKLPEADIAFLDEYWNGSSAVVNTMNTIVNEHTFDAGDGPKKVKLRMLVGASNLMPTNETHENSEAAFDRFLLRMEVDIIRSKSGLRRLLWDENLGKPLSVSITVDELDVAQKEAAKLKWSLEAQEAIMAIIDRVGQEVAMPTPRRLRKARFAVQAYAWLQGAAKVMPEHLEILKHCLWTTPIQIAPVQKIVIALSNPIITKIKEALDDAEKVYAAFDRRTDKMVASGTETLAKLKQILTNLKKLAPDGQPPAKLTQAMAKVKALGLDVKSATTYQPDDEC